MSLDNLNSIDSIDSRHTSKFRDDPYLQPYLGDLDARVANVSNTLARITGEPLGQSSGDALSSFANGHHYFPLHLERVSGGGLSWQWVIREWAPNAMSIYLFGDFSGWKVRTQYAFTSIGGGMWELRLPKKALSHGQLYKLRIIHGDGIVDRLPSYTVCAVQDERTKDFCAKVYAPLAKDRYKFRHPAPAIAPTQPLIIYETHIGIAQESESVGTYAEFTANTLPHIAGLGYNAIQIMAIAEHPYYGSFGYHVSNYFAPSSRFGSPEDLKHLVDTAHSMGLVVIMDIIHSHSVKNEAEGLGKFDGTQEQYFYEGAKGYHELWDSYLFNYGKDQVLHFLLSNIKYWKEEFRLDGFRFDGVTSMLYHSHGLGKAFTGYHDYFDQNEVNQEAYTYLSLANLLLQSLSPNSISIAEDVSGMPGTCAAVGDGGMGFTHRMAMGVSDMWFKLLDTPYETWDMFYMWHELTTKRNEEQTVTYVESHDQALVGGKTFIFTIADSTMYDGMHAVGESLKLDASLALHKLARFATLYTAQNGYLNFMGNEFGHPEWLDFPREENGFSHKYARRLWSIAQNEDLNYGKLLAFDQAIVGLATSSGALQDAITCIGVFNDEKIIAFQRGNHYFVINFNQTSSFKGYSISVEHQTLVPVLNSDEAEFGGFDRLSTDAPTGGNPHPSNHIGVLNPETQKYDVQLYLPAFTAIVFRGEN